MSGITQNEYKNIGIASGLNDEGSNTPFELWAGEAKIRTSQAVATVTLPQFQTFAFDANGGMVAWNPAANDTTANWAGVTAQPILAGDTGPYYEGGIFNIAALKLPASIAADPTTALAKLKAATVGKSFGVNKLL